MAVVSQDKHILTLLQEGASVVSRTNFRDASHRRFPSTDRKPEDEPAEDETPGFSSRAWESAARRALRGGQGQFWLEEYKLALRTALIGVAVIAYLADRKTGRRMYTGYEKIGALMAARLRKAGAKTGASKRLVANLFRILEELGLVHLDVPATGSGGRGRPNEYSLIVPPSIPARIAPYQTGTTCSTPSHLSPLVTKSAQGAPATKPKPKKKPAALEPPKIDDWRFADELTVYDIAARWAYPTQSDKERGYGSKKPRHLAEIARAAGSRLNTGVWTAKHWAKACDLLANAYGHTSLTRSTNPVGLFHKRADHIESLVTDFNDPHRCLRELEAWSHTERAKLKARVDQQERERRGQARRREEEASRPLACEKPARELIAEFEALRPPESVSSDDAKAAAMARHCPRFMPSRLRKNIQRTPPMHRERQAS